MDFVAETFEIFAFGSVVFAVVACSLLRQACASLFQIIIEVSLPPIEISFWSSTDHRTFVTCELWPLYFLNLANFVAHGYRNSLTRPKSSPVARVARSAVRHVVFTSVTSEHGGQMPSQLGPRTLVNVCHVIFVMSSERMLTRLPDFMGWK